MVPESQDKEAPCELSSNNSYARHRPICHGELDISTRVDLSQCRRSPHACSLFKQFLQAIIGPFSKIYRLRKPFRFGFLPCSPFRPVWRYVFVPPWQLVQLSTLRINALLGVVYKVCKVCMSVSKAPTCKVGPYVSEYARSRPSQRRSVQD